MFIISIIFLSIQPFILKKHAIEFKTWAQNGSVMQKKKGVRIKIIFLKKYNITIHSEL
jgi:hypothetical protein